MVFHCNSSFEEQEFYNNYKLYFNQYPYPLSNFQKWAIYSIVTGNHTLVTAHTGSGKTLPAEFAIEYFKKTNKKVIYTGPIKALCNQKYYDFKKKYPHISFGILTGDVKDNPEADVLIMTTEILRNTLFSKMISNDNKKNNMTLHFEMDFENELAAVVFDEVHYIGDVDRGSVWEQSILLLPPQVQLIMLSATIEKPEVFANWVEKEKNKHYDNIQKTLYMATTNTRVVPLTHYGWVSCNKSYHKYVKNTPYEQKFKENMNKPIVLAETNGTFDDKNYYKINDLTDYMYKNKMPVKRNFVLNELIRYLYQNNMLPAICFIFSRKNVELWAQDICVSLYEADDKTPSIIEKECEMILISKLKNYKEYMEMDEYKNLITLLRKGIAIHHAGVMPILREMVELLFEKGYIKLLFATETFAVGINMPTKTVIFTSLTKYNGNTMRLILPHEYTQMAGRAGRRGIDTVGHVIHCNNIFEMPSFNEYKKMLTGSPKMLTSQFKLSFNLLLNIIASNNDIDNFDFKLLKNFIDKSFMQNDIIKEVNSYNNTITDINSQIDLCREKLSVIFEKKTNEKTLIKYDEVLQALKLSSNKQRKKLSKEICDIEELNQYIKQDIITYNELKKLSSNLKDNEYYKECAINYTENTIQLLCKLLIDNNFITNEYKLHDKAIIAMQLQEVHSMALSDLYSMYNGFNSLSTIDIIKIFSCFTNIRLSDELKKHKPNCNNNYLDKICNELSNKLHYYYDMEVSNDLNTGMDYNIHFDLIDYIEDWCNATDEITCKNILINIKQNIQIFTGEFVKAILKINNIALEFEKICETLNNVQLLNKIRTIPNLTLKYIATNQSLYI